MNEIISKSHDFELAKQKIQSFSNNLPADPRFSKVRTEAGLFGWRDHKVTGAELNDHITSVQDTIISLNSTNRSIVKEFGEIYNALEALDKDYIQEILIAQKSAEKANSEVRDAQVGINHTVEAIKATVEALKRFKAETTDDINYLKSLNGEGASKITERLTSLENDMNNVQEAIESHIDNYAAFCDELNKLIDAINNRITDYSDYLKALENRHNVLNQSFITKTEEIVAEAKSLAEKHTGLVNKHADLEQKHSVLEQAHSELVQKHSTLEQAVAEFAETTNKSIEEIGNALKEHDERLNEQRDCLNEHGDILKEHGERLTAIESEIASIKEEYGKFKEDYAADKKKESKRIMISHIIGATSLLLVVTLFILNICKVL